MRFDIATLFPSICEAYLGESIIGRAVKEGKLSVACHNIRDHTENKHRRVDDVPYGGGMGMVLECAPVFNCFQAVCEELGSRPHVVHLTPQGKQFSQTLAKDLLEKENIFLLCGHYEGIDERVVEEIVDEEVSLGDFVLTGGELPALCVVDCVARMLPGVLSNDECFEDESHWNGLLEYAQFTRPSVWKGKEVPKVLLSGHHAKINEWRTKSSLSRTRKKRPDLYRRFLKNRNKDINIK